jgi:hypothetical protein
METQKIPNNQMNCWQKNKACGINISDIKTLHIKKTASYCHQNRDVQPCEKIVYNSSTHEPMTMTVGSGVRSQLALPRDFYVSLGYIGKLWFKNK